MPAAAVHMVLVRQYIQEDLAEAVRQVTQPIHIMEYLEPMGLAAVVVPGVRWVLIGM